MKITPLLLCVSLLIGVGVGDYWQVQAQQNTQQRHRHQKQSRSASSSRSPLHNNKHEAPIRNILTPKFKSTDPNPLIQGNHTSNVAIIVSSSRYWFNYRHVTNALSIYQLLKKGGMTDDNIILMLADDIPCNQRNKYRGKIYPRGIIGGDLMKGVEIDYTGTDVTVDSFLRVLLGRHVPGEHHGGQRSWPNINEETNVLVYLTGHGGDNFFKFQGKRILMIGNGIMVPSCTYFSWF